MSAKTKKILITGIVCAVLVALFWFVPANAWLSSLLVLSAIVWYSTSNRRRRFAIRSMERYIDQLTYANDRFNGLYDTELSEAHQKLEKLRSRSKIDDRHD